MSRKPSVTWNSAKERFEAAYIWFKPEGWSLDRSTKIWWTKNPALVSRITDLDEAAIEQLEVHQLRYLDSRAEKGSYDDPRLYPFQVAGKEWLEGSQCALLGDDPGLGKTVQTISAAKDLGFSRICIVAPKTVVGVWESHLREWWPEVDHEVMTRRSQQTLGTTVTIIPWSILASIDLSAELVVFDESHFAKNPSAQRTKAAKRLAQKADYRWLLSGTPIPNNPIELWSQLQLLDNPLGMSYKGFVRRYCGSYYYSHQEIRRYGQPQNLQELEYALRSTIMMRRRKADVLPYLPQKIRRIVLMQPTSDISRTLTLEWEEWNKVISGERAAIGRLSELRRQVALSKVPFVVEHTKAAIEERGGPYVVFAHHHDVIDQLQSKLGVPTLDGRTPTRIREELIRRFQQGQEQGLIAGLLVGGTGITLTRASWAIFAELDWTPGQNIQAEDRIHRIGQSLPVEIDYVIYPESVDARIVNVVQGKESVIEQVMEGTCSQN